MGKPEHKPAPAQRDNKSDYGSILSDHAIMAKFQDRIKKGKCWEWTGNLRKGYGVLYISGRKIPAHRLAFEHWNGKLIKGMSICHTCDNKRCANPAHLFQAPQKENMADMVRKNRQRKATGKQTTPEEVIIIRKLKLKYGASNKQIAEIFSLSEHQVYKIASGRAFDESGRRKTA